jgi:hypothetical protein
MIKFDLIFEFDFIKTSPNTLDAIPNSTLSPIVGALPEPLYFSPKQT